MFIIVPKPGGPASRVEPSDSARGPSRTQNACQSCKVRKAKCDGAKPCSRCRTRNVVCVYGKADAAKLALAMTPERSALLQEQNDRLTQAARRMAARLAALEARHDKASCEDCHDSDRLGDSPAAAQHADITEILDRYAPAPAPSAATQRSHQSTRHGGTASEPQVSKKRRVEDQDSQPHSPTHMIVPTSQLQPGQMIDNELTTGSAQPNLGLLHTDDAVAAATSNPDTFDPYSTAYQTLLQISQAHETRATQLRGQEGVIAPAIANTAHAMPASMGPDGQDPSLYVAPDPLGTASTAANAGIPDALLDLVDWDLSLENCDPINWDWNNYGQ